MPTHIITSWPLLCAVFGTMLFLLLMINFQHIHFYTKDVVLRKFSFIELQISATPTELAILINGLYNLPGTTSITAIKALKKRLYLGFLFMPFAYGAIFILCVQLAGKMVPAFGANIFMCLAFLQPIALLCNLVENIYLLNKIKPNTQPSTAWVHKAFLILEGVKFGIALISTICAASAVLYFWLTGHYTTNSLTYLFVMLLQVVVFVIISNLVFRKNDRSL